MDELAETCRATLADIRRRAGLPGEAPDAAAMAALLRRCEAEVAGCIQTLQDWNDRHRDLDFLNGPLAANAEAEQRAARLLADLADDGSDRYRWSMLALCLAGEGLLTMAGRHALAPNEYKVRLPSAFVYAMQ